MAASKKKKTTIDLPLTKDGYFSVPVVSPNSTAMGNGVAAIQKAVGVDETGIYDEALREAVMKAQADAGIEASGVVDAQAWDVLVNGASPSED